MPTDDTVLEPARELSVLARGGVVVAGTASTTGGQPGDASAVDTGALRVKLAERGALLGYPFAARAGE
jgi:hypothetical protein